MTVTHALGISIGDIVRTSYDTGPYEVVSIWGPRLYYQSGVGVLAFWDRPIISLTLVDAGERRRDQSHLRWINNIWRDGDRWFAMQGRDEIFVTPGALAERNACSVQLDMFAPAPTPAPEPHPWQFQDGVDYEAGDGRLWHCGKCPCDFNTEEKKRKPVWCPKCGSLADALLNMSIGSQNVFLRGLGA